MRKWQTIKEYEDIKFDFFEGIAKITINRPRVYNAFRPQTNKEMLDAMTICRGAPSECTRFAQGNPFTSQTCDRYGQRLCDRRRACVACNL